MRTDCLARLAGAIRFRNPDQRLLNLGPQHMPGHALTASIFSLIFTLILLFAVGLKQKGGMSNVCYMLDFCA